MGKVVDYIEDEADRQLRPPDGRFWLVTYRPPPGIFVEELNVVIDGQLYPLGPNFRTLVPQALEPQLSAQVEAAFGGQVLICSDSPKEATT